jgi:hypothetical protein
MLLDYVYRSRNSNLSPVVDVDWLKDSVMVVAFANGLIEVEDTEDREILDTIRFEDRTLMNVVPLDKNRLIVQTKNDSISLWKGSKCLWTVANRTSISFSKPVIWNGEHLVHVAGGQCTVSILRVETAYVESVIDLSSHGCSGMVVAMQTTGDTVFILTESGHVAHLGLRNDKMAVLCVVSVPFPSDKEEESIVPTAFVVCPDRTFLVGFSNGSLMDSSSSKEVHKLESGIGQICEINDTVLIGSWNGDLCTLSRDWLTIHPIKSPHRCSITRIVLKGEKIVVGSTDGRASVWMLN